LAGAVGPGRLARCPCSRRAGGRGVRAPGRDQDVTAATPPLGSSACFAHHGITIMVRPAVRVCLCVWVVGWLCVCVVRVTASTVIQHCGFGPQAGCRLGPSPSSAPLPPPFSPSPPRPLPPFSPPHGHAPASRPQRLRAGLRDSDYASEQASETRSLSPRLGDGFRDSDPGTCLEDSGFVCLSVSSLKHSLVRPSRSRHDWRRSLRSMTSRNMGAV
jgi:hypothetical protein